MPQAQGDTIAQTYLETIHSRPHRVFEALFHAAADIRPEARQLAKMGRYTRECRALVDWFQMTYPRQAREIENSLEKAETTLGKKDVHKAR
jgi:hypothetical protein